MVNVDLTKSGKYTLSARKNNIISGVIKKILFKYMCLHEGIQNMFIKKIWLRDLFHQNGEKNYVLIG